MKYDQHENCAKCGYPGKTVEHKSTYEHGRVKDEWLQKKHFCDLRAP